MKTTSEAGYPVYSNFYETEQVDPIQQLMRHEGYKPHPYRDRYGFWSIGYGTLLSPDTRLDESQARRIANARHGLHERMSYDEREMQLRSQLVHDYATAMEDVDAYAKERNIKLNDVQRRVLGNIAYTVGATGIREFKKMWRALKRGDRNAAAYEIMNSKYATDVRDRALELYSMMKHSELDLDGLRATASATTEEGTETEA